MRGGWWLFRYTRSVQEPGGTAGRGVFVTELSVTPIRWFFTYSVDVCDLIIWISSLTYAEIPCCL